VTLIGSDEEDFRRRAETSGRDPEDLRAGSAIAGTPAEALDRLARAASDGASTLYLQLQDLRDLEHVELLAEHLLPAARNL
jgi:alkanesulfonate monooxygenase SsuD/methylene tetrahydromethanopterin reductase-like flavin-dependent oxidoreductase (luciferase family)